MLKTYTFILRSNRREFESCYNALSMSEARAYVLADCEKYGFEYVALATVAPWNPHRI